MTTLNDALQACLHVDIDAHEALHAIGAGASGRAVLEGLTDSPLSARIRLRALPTSPPDTDEPPLPQRDLLVLLGDVRDEGALAQLEVLAQAASVADQTILALIAGAPAATGEVDVPTVGSSALQSLWRYVDTLLAVPASAADQAPDDSLGPREGTQLERTAHTLLTALHDYLFEPGLINGDFSDLLAVLSAGGTAALTTADAEGAHAVRDALAKVLDQPDFELWLTETTEGLLAVIRVGFDGDMAVLTDAFDELRTRMPELAATAFCAPLAPEMANACRITLLATRC